MATRLDPADRLRKLFQRRMCWMIGELAEALGCAVISVRRLLKQVGYFHSYTHNGKFYTLESVPRFNPEGIWRHRGIGFSKQGSLIATLIYLIGRSRAGLSAKELAEKLEHPCHALLTNLYKNGQLDRIKVAGQFRYLGVEPRLNHRQRAQAQAARPPTPPAALSTQAALLVLVEHVKNPSLSFEQIASCVQKHRQMAVAPESIRRFFDEQGLKKTTET